MTMLQVSDITKEDGRGLVLDAVSFTQQKLRKIAIAGETGSGKSTLLKIIAGHTQPDAGKVIFEGERVEGPEEKLIPGHPHIAYLSQYFELPKFVRVEETLPAPDNIPEMEPATLYDICRISHLLKRKTDELSGGEKQRIALARLLTYSTKVLLLDEPFSNLDLNHKNILKSVIQDVCDALDISGILVSHDPVDTLSWADEIFVMRNGRIIQKGAPESVYSHPQDLYTAGLLGKYDLLDMKDFRELPEGIHKGRQVLLRPENLKIVPAGDHSLSGTVSDMAFYGGYYELKIDISGKSVTVRSESDDFLPGDTVYLKANLKNLNIF